MNFVTVQFYNESIFEFDGLVKGLERPLYHVPIIRPEVREWLNGNIGPSHYELGVNDSGTNTWRGAALLSTSKTSAGAGSGMPLWNTYWKEYRFIFADPAKAVLFKLTWV
jgi:hypothetical protein